MISLASTTGGLAEWIYDPVCDILSRYWYGKSSGHSTYGTVGRDLQYLPTDGRGENNAGKSLAMRRENAKWRQNFDGISADKIRARTTHIEICSRGTTHMNSNRTVEGKEFDSI
jgi:hypothetical protein